MQEFASKELPPEATQATRRALADLAAPDPLAGDTPDPHDVCFYDIALGAGLRVNLG